MAKAFLTIRHGIFGGSLQMLAKRTDHEACKPWWFTPNPNAPLPEKIDDESVIRFADFWNFFDPFPVDGCLFQKSWNNKEPIQINDQMYDFDIWSSWLTEPRHKMTDDQVVNGLDWVFKKTNKFEFDPERGLIA